MTIHVDLDKLLNRPNRSLAVHPADQASSQKNYVKAHTLSREELEARKAAQTARQGVFAWAKLHSYTGCDPQWLDLWQFFIPQRCDCKDGYQKILEEMPPDFTSPEAFFAWGVALHNAVNTKLGKPELTIDEARKIWRRNDGCSEDSGSNLP